MNNRMPELYRGADGQVRPEELRRYLGALAYMRRTRSGLHNVTITVDPMTTQLDLLKVEALGRTDITVRVGRQHWDA